MLLADEINRTTPRTQSALLEAMGERQTTVDNRHHALSKTFFVIATQNPIEHHGTYPLPEAQLDRFAMKLSIGYPDRGSELEMLADAVTSCGNRGPAGSTLDRNGLAALQSRAADVAVEPTVRGYLVDLAAATRSHPRVRLGLSPRGLLTWQRVAQAWAFMKSRPFATPDDIQDVARPVLDVRLGLDPDAGSDTIDEILRRVPVPV